MGSKRVEEEYKMLAESNAWAQVYQSIGHRCAAYPYTYDEAKKVENKPLNRYRDVNPFDHSRVVLQRGDTDYINANHVRVERANRKYILTQGPLVYTVGHFWTMVWEQDARVIVMLNKLVEKNEVKCHWYWPHGPGMKKELDLSDYNLSITHIWEEDYKFYTVRAFMLTELDTMEQRVIIQFHYTTWPDFEVPASPVEFLEFLKKIRETGVLEKEAPVIVHCSAGIGRSGTFCLVDSVLLLIEKEGQENIDIQQILLDMRKYRMGLIQTSEQLRFSYLAIIEGIKQLDPNYVPPKMDESLYATVSQEEETPPPPPPRGASLGQPPARPLPAIPMTTSLENIEQSAAVTSSDDDPVLPVTPVEESTSSTSSSEDDQDVVTVVEEIGCSAAAMERAALRRRRIDTMAERIAKMKKRSRDADRWHSVKRLKTDENEQEPKPDE